MNTASSGSMHGHAHAQPHAPDDFNRAFSVGVALNALFVAIEAFYGWRTGSLALLADAGHNLSDVAGLLLAWAGAWAVRLRPDDRHTYGWQRATILAALINAVLLLLAMGWLGWEAFHRLHDPQPVEGRTVMAVAGLGIVINAATAALFMRGRNDLNIRGAFLHMAADALVSAGVVVAGGLALWRGWLWIDPLTSLLIAAVIVVGTAGLFKQSLHLLFDGVPAHIDLSLVQERLLSFPGVQGINRLHVWALGTSQVALTAHLVMPAGHPGDTFLAEVTEALHDQFDIESVTLQVVRDPSWQSLCGRPRGRSALRTTVRLHILQPSSLHVCTSYAQAPKTSQNRHVDLLIWRPASNIPRSSD